MALVLQRVQSPSTEYLSSDPATTLPNNTIATDYIIGGEFTVLQDITIQSIRWGFFRGSSGFAAIWDSTGALVGSAYINTAGDYGDFAGAPLLTAGKTYRVGVQCAGGMVMSPSHVPTVVSAELAPYITIGHGWVLTSTALVRPTTDNGVNWVGDIGLKFAYRQITTSDPPPEMLVEGAANQFTLNLPSDWLPNIWSDWNLQYQTSIDNSTFGPWKNVDTIEFPETSYNFAATNIEDKPFYRFQYKLNTGGSETNWSEATIAGKVQNAVDASELTGQITGAQIGNQTITGDNIVAGTITANNIAANSITGDIIKALTIVTNNLSAGSVTADKIAANAIEAQHISAGSITAGTIAAGAINTVDLIATGLINGNHIGIGVINGVHIMDGAITAENIASNTITAKQLATGFLDANVAFNSYIEADSIKGGELSLGGLITARYDYSNPFIASDGEVKVPWQISFGGGAQAVSQTTGKALSGFTYNVDWGFIDGTVPVFHIDLAQSKTGTLADLIKFMYYQGVSNKITNIQFNVDLKLSANYFLELIDETGAVRGSWQKSNATYVTSGDLEGVDLSSKPASQIGFQLRCGTTGAIAAGNYVQINTVELTFEKGYGILSVYDADSNLKAEMTANYILFNKIDGGQPTPTFRADEDGVWVPSDGLKIGSSAITDLTYNLRDLSGNLVINNRFENRRSIPDPADNTLLAYVPSDWTYLYNDGTNINVAENYFSITDGIFPQQQSLVGGRALKMTLQTGWTSTKHLLAASHKRYIEASDTMPQMPFAMSAYFRTPVLQTNVTVQISLYASTSSLDITSGGDFTRDILLGKTSSTGAAISALTVDGNITFAQLEYSYFLATNINDMVLQTANGKYVYCVLEAWCSTGSLASNVSIEWDNVDVFLAEGNTPSDNQTEADLARRIESTQTTIQYFLAGNKCVLYEASTGLQGLVPTAVN